MKRRSFIATTAVVGSCISTGFAATSSMLVSSSPWHFVKGLNQSFVESIDVFANEVRENFKGHFACNKLVSTLITPKKIISQDLKNGKLVYQNAASNFVCIKKENNRVKVSILSSMLE